MLYHEREHKKVQVGKDQEKLSKKPIAFILIRISSTNYATFSMRRFFTNVIYTSPNVLFDFPACFYSA